MGDVHAATEDEAQMAVVPVESVAERRTRKRALLENAVALVGRTREALQHQVHVYSQLDRLEERKSKRNNRTACVTRCLLVALIVVLLVVVLVLIGVLFAQWWAGRSSRNAVAVGAINGTSGRSARGGGGGLVLLYAVLRALFGVRWPVWPPLVDLCVPAALLALALVALLRRNVYLLLLFDLLLLFLLLFDLLRLGVQLSYITRVLTLNAIDWLLSTLGSGLEERLLEAINAYGTDPEMTATIDTLQETELTLPIFFNQGNCTANMLKWMGNTGSYRILAYLVTRLLFELVLGLLLIERQQLLLSRKRRLRARKQKSAFKTRPRPSLTPSPSQPLEKKNIAPRKLPSCPAAFASQAASRSREKHVSR